MFAASKSGSAVGGGPGPGPGPTPTDPSFAYVPLLLNTTSTDGQQNNTFLDSGTANGGVGFTITRNGTPTQGSITPYWPNGQWSNYFNGSNAYLTVPSNSALNLTANFTVEFWAYATTTTNAVDQVFNYGNFTFILYHNGTTWTVEIGNGSSNYFTLTGTASLNAWHHFAITRNTNTYTFWIDGASASTTINANPPATSGASLFIGKDQVGGQRFTGYLSNFRIVKGTALYTTPFTPPTTPLTAITNTSILTCQSNRFIDNSTNNFTLTVNGTPTVQAFQPFSPTASYTTALYGGSGYFNGSTDSISAARQSAFLLGTNNFTIEFWVYFNSVTAGQTVAGSHITSAAGDWLIYTATTGNLNYYLSSTGATWNIANQVAIGAVVTGTWYHVALVRNGSVFTPYLNGVAGTTTNSSASLFASTSPVSIAASNNPSTYFSGYVSNFRMVNGTAIVPSVGGPTTPVTNVTNTSLLLNFTNAGIYDAAAQNVITTVADSQVSSTITPKWGTTSMKFDGVTDALSIPSSTSFGLGAGDWTIEFWVNLNALTTQTLVSMLASVLNFQPHIYYSVGSGIRYYTNGADRITGGTLTTGVWNYIAVTKSSGVTRMYINGTQTGSNYTDANNYGTANPLFVGDYGVPLTGIATLNGYVQDVRITKGVARTVTTIPTAPFPTR
jgi:hypothetical protein